MGHSARFLLLTALPASLAGCPRSAPPPAGAPPGTPPTKAAHGRGGEQVYGLGIQAAKVETDVYFYYFLWGNGGEILGPDGKCALNSPQGVAALQFMLDLVKEGCSEPDPTAYNREGLQELFQAGRLGMMITGPWFWGMLKEKAPGLEYGIAPIPGATTQATMAVTDNLVLFKDSRSKAAAMTFMRFFFDRDRQVAWDQSEGMLPGLKAVAEADFVTQSPDWSAFMELLPTGKFVPLHPKWKEIADQITASLQAAHTGELTAQQALDQAKGECDAILAASPPKPRVTDATRGAEGSPDEGKVTFLAMEYSTKTKPFLERVKQEFAQQYPRIELSIQVVPWDEGMQKIKTLVNAHQPPDLVNIATLWLPELVDLDVVEPLDERLDPAFRDQFIPFTLHGAEYEGKLYGLPIAVSARALYYNQALFRRAGIAEPPQTWDELRAAAQAISALPPS